MKHSLHVSKKEDHPHACGDKRYEFFTTENATGSSPRVWGQVALPEEDFKIAGIIPTRVGTSIPEEVNEKLTEGSSPRVWGQDLLPQILYKGGRIIPTRVGTSGSKNMGKIWTGDHPHACGDKA